MKYLEGCDVWLVLIDRILVVIRITNHDAHIYFSKRSFTIAV